MTLKGEKRKLFEIKLSVQRGGKDPSNAKEDVHGKFFT